MKIEVTTPPSTLPLRKWKTAPMNFAVAESDMDLGGDPVIIGIFTYLVSAERAISASPGLKRMQLSLASLESGREQLYHWSESDSSWIKRRL